MKAIVFPTKKICNKRVSFEIASINLNRSNSQFQQGIVSFCEILRIVVTFNCLFSKMEVEKLVKSIICSSALQHNQLRVRSTLFVSRDDVQNNYQHGEKACVVDRSRAGL
jgi:hypothetical protein